MNTLAILLALGASICWALVMVLVKVGLKRMDFVSFAAIRPLFALVFIVPYGLLTADFKFSGFDLVGIAVLGGFLDSFVGSLLFFIAIEKISAHKATALSTTAPFWGVIAAVVFLGERPQPIIYIAAILVVIGAYFLSIRRKDAFSGNHSILAALLALAAGILWGVAETVPAKYCLTHGMTPVTYQLIAVAIAGVSWGLVAILKSRKHRLHYPWGGLKIALLTAFLSFVLGWILWLSGLKIAPASLLAPIHGSMTLFAFLFSILLLRERPSARSIGGAVLVFGGVFLVSVLG